MAAETPSTSTLPHPTYPIKTVVVLVQENRSFDHMLGWMHKSMNPYIDSVTDPRQYSNPISTTDPDSALIYFGDGEEYVDPDLGHTIQAIYEDVFMEPWSEESAAKELKPMMRGFAQNAERIQKGMSEIVMKGFTPGSVSKRRVAEYGVCDRWFALLGKIRGFS